MTERPEYNSKVALMSALAPVAFTQNMISPLRFIAPFSTQIEVSTLKMVQIPLTSQIIYPYRFFSGSWK